MAALKSYPVWDRPTRCFHWLNLLFVLVLAGLGLTLLYDDALGLSRDGKLLVKTLHVWTGYGFALNLALRLIWAFVGNHYARWRQLLPGGPGYAGELHRYWTALRSGGQGIAYLGHNPLGRLAIAAMLLVMSGQALTGLVLAGTDLFYPPFGHWIAQWLAAPGIDPASLLPGHPELVDKAAMTEMRALRKPFVRVHEYGFYLLAMLAFVHVAGVVVTELREGGGLISAMVTGRKLLAGKPVDEVSHAPDGKQ